MIGVIDYGLGNMFSLANALSFLGAAYATIKSPEEGEGLDGLILPGVGSFPEEGEGLDGLILPGVGSFPEGAERLAASGMDTFIKQYKSPILGICLGMQLLFEESEEFGAHKGLALLPGRVVKLDYAPKIPHIGWNELNILLSTPLTRPIPSRSHFYFVHSYKAVTERKYMAAVADYYQEITAIVFCGKVYGTQFHPEKSGAEGIAMLKNFVDLCEEAR